MYPGQQPDADAAWLWRPPPRAPARFRPPGNTSRSSTSTPTSPGEEGTAYGLRLTPTRSAAASPRGSNSSQAIRFYEEVLKISPDDDDAEKARGGLDTIGETLLTQGNQLADRGDTRQAQRVYQQIVRSLPRTRAAETARDRLKSLASRKSL